MIETMNSADIAFPNLGIYLENVPKNFSVFGFSIAFYGLIIGIGVMAGIAMAAREAKRTGQNPDDYWDFAIYAIIFSIVGARLYYVIFSWDHYKNNLSEIINLRKGGLAIYGAVIAAFITLFVYTRIKKKSFWQMADTGVLGLILGQIIGRWGNFMNGEAYGYQTDAFIRMGLQNANTRYDFGTLEMVFVHPTFLYESLWNLVGFILINLFYKHRKYDGQVFMMVFGWYGLGRLWIEGLRTDSLMIFGDTVRVSQLLAILIFIASASALIYFFIKKPNKPLFVAAEKEIIKKKK